MKVRKRNVTGYERDESDSNKEKDLHGWMNSWPVCYKQIDKYSSSSSNRGWKTRECDASLHTSDSTQLTVGKREPVWLSRFGVAVQVQAHRERGTFGRRLVVSRPCAYCLLVLCPAARERERNIQAKIMRKLLPLIRLPLPFTYSFPLL